MVSAISSSTAAYYNSLSISKGSDWIASTVTAIKNSQAQAGIIGALANSGNGVTINSFLSSSASFANNFATIAQSNVTNSGSLYAQIASDNQKQAAAKKAQDALDALNAQQQQVQPGTNLDPVIYLGDGVTIDTTSNIMTMTDGTQIDITTGSKVVDPSTIIELGNGSYLNTDTNILTLADGTQIDTVTGLQVTS
jgi:hypothetical protein